MFTYWQWRIEQSNYKIVWLLILVVFITLLELPSHALAQFPDGEQEQAIIVAYSGSLSSNQTLRNSSSITLVCVAFGLPSPQITWESHDPIAEGVNTNVSEFETYIERDEVGLNYTISILQFCNVTNLAQLSDTTCTAKNGITSERSIGVSFSVTFDAIAMETLTTDPVTMDPVTITTEITTTTDSTVILPDSFSSMIVWIIAVAVVVCVIALSVAIVASTLIVVLFLRNKKGSSSPSVAAENDYRVYTNSLYDGEVGRRQQGGNEDETNDERLYTCEAYEGVDNVPHEYAYVSPPTGLRHLNQSQNKDKSKEEGFALHRCAAYNAVSGVQHSYEETFT